MREERPIALLLLGLAEPANAGVVVAVLCGHDHKGGYHRHEEARAPSGDGGGGRGGGEDGADGAVGRDGDAVVTSLATHHVTFQSPLNLGAAGGAFGAIDVYEDRLELHGPALEHWLAPELLASGGQ